VRHLLTKEPIQASIIKKQIRKAIKRQVVLSLPFLSGVQFAGEKELRKYIQQFLRKKYLVIFYACIYLWCGSNT
jgi:hypothetical protein